MRISYCIQSANEMDVSYFHEKKIQCRQPEIFIAVKKLLRTKKPDVSLNNKYL
jgi:hypothetical protein